MVGGIVDALRRNGCTVVVISSPLTAGIDQRTISLQEAIVEHFASRPSDDEPKVHLIGELEIDSELGVT